MNKHSFAKWGVIILFPPNALLTAIFFFLLIGNLSAIFGVEYGWMISLIISLMLGVGLVVGETVGHLTNAEKNEHSPGIYLILILLAATNWGAGVYRSADNARERSMTAISRDAKDDVRYKSLLKEKENLEVNVLNDRREGNDIRAIDRQEKINEELKEIEDKYSTKASLLNAGGKWNLIISLAFIVINLVYGLCVKAAYEGPVAQKKKGRLDRIADAVEQRISGGGNSSPRSEPIRKHTPQPSTAEHRPKGDIGFRSESVEKKTPYPTADGEEDLERGSITFSNQNGSDRDYRGMNAKGNDTIRRRIEKDRQKLRQYIAKANPEPSVQEVCQLLKCSPNTARTRMQDVGL